jgi:hypothetical protein
MLVCHPLPRTTGTGASYRCSVRQPVSQSASRALHLWSAALVQEDVRRSAGAAGQVRVDIVCKRTQWKKGSECGLWVASQTVNLWTRTWMPHATVVNVELTKQGSAATHMYFLALMAESVEQYEFGVQCFGWYRKCIDVRKPTQAGAALCSCHQVTECGAVEVPKLSVIFTALDTPGEVNDLSD